MYQVQVTPGTNNSDRINVLGTASIGGSALDVARTSGGLYTLDTRYTVLNATGGVTGTYAALTGDTRTAFTQLFDSYDANNVYLTAKSVRQFVAAGVTPNQIATAGALDTLVANSPLRSAIALLPNDIAARGAFDQLSGEIHASVKTAAMQDSRFVREAAFERLRAATCAPGASTSMQTDRKSPLGAQGSCAPAGEERVAWAQAFGSWGKVRGDGNAQGIDRDIGGFFVGADTGIGNGWRVGALGGYSRSTSDTDGSNGTARGSSKTDSYHLGVYGGNQWASAAGVTSLRLGASATWNRLETQRAVAFAGFADNLSGRYDSRTTQVFGEVGHRIDAGSVALEPFVNLAHVQLSSDSFSERGGLAALQGSGDSFSSTFATLGLRASTQIGEKTRLRGMLGWRRAFGDTVPYSNQSLAGSFASFTVAGVPLARNVGVVEAGVDTELAPNLTLGAAYSGQFGSGLRDHGLKVSLGWKF